MNGPPSAPKRGGCQPAEWEPHDAVWIAWPAARDLWLDRLEAVQDTFVALCRAVSAPRGGSASWAGEGLDVLVRDPHAESQARAALAGLPARFHAIPYGDIWLRDTAPVFTRDERGSLVASTFGWNGWGGRYRLPHDDGVARAIARAWGGPSIAFPQVLEGGSIDSDGAGTVLTTRQCLLHPNRNPGLGQAGAELLLADALGARRVLWLGDGLRNDHTDGHVDNLARFVGPARVLCMEPAGPSDPNRDVLDQVLRDLASFRDASGRTLEVVATPSPGAVLDESGQVMPASYANFYIGNAAVIVPQYGAAGDDRAVATLATLFPRHRVVGLPSRDLLAGGGSFHCITQQQPAARRPGEEDP